MSEFTPGHSFYSTTSAEPSPAAPVKAPAPKASPAPAASPRWAGIVSSVFSPLLLPTYGAILALWTTPLNSVRESVRLTTALMVLVITCFLPLGVMMAAIRMGKISDTKVRDRRQRYLLYPVAVIAYGLTAIYLYNVHAPGWFIGFFLGACLASIISMTINFRWKISAHATCCGGVLGLCFFIAFSGLNSLFFLPWLTGAVLITGAVASARLALKAHTQAQILAGTAVGIAAVIIMMSIFY